MGKNETVSSNSFPPPLRISTTPSFSINECIFTRITLSAFSTPITPIDEASSTPPVPLTGNQVSLQLSEACGSKPAFLTGLI